MHLKMFFICKRIRFPSSRFLNMSAQSAAREPRNAAGLKDLSPSWDHERRPPRSDLIMKQNMHFLAHRRHIAKFSKNKKIATHVVTRAPVKSSAIKAAGGERVTGGCKSGRSDVDVVELKIWNQASTLKYWKQKRCKRLFKPPLPAPQPSSGTVLQFLHAVMLLVNIDDLPARRMHLKAKRC